MGRKSLAKERRAQILDAFYRCITRDGLQRASIREIAKEAGVQPSILHHYFKDRDEMVEELVKNAVEGISARYLAEIGRHKDPKIRFVKAIEFLFGPDMLNNDGFGFFYDCWAEARRNKKVRKSFSELYCRFRQGIIDLLVETNKAMGLSTTQLKELATMIVSIQDGVSIQWDMDRKNVSLKKMTRLTRELIELYLEKKRTGTKRKTSVLK